MELDFLVCCSFRGGRLMTAALLQTGCRPEQSARRQRHGVNLMQPELGEEDGTYSNPFRS